MKLVGLSIMISLMIVALTDDLCPRDVQTECLTDVNQGFASCDKAAKQRSKDITADINCIKYMAAVSQDCWPCICKIANENQWKIKGCPS